MTLLRPARISRAEVPCVNVRFLVWHPDWTVAFVAEYDWQAFYRCREHLERGLEPGKSQMDRERMEAAGWVCTEVCAPAIAAEGGEGDG